MKPRQSALDAYEAARRPTPPVDQAQLQRERPSPIKELKIKRSTGAIVGVVLRAVRPVRTTPVRQPAARPTAARRQSGGRPRQSRAGPDEGDSSESDIPGAAPREVEPRELIGGRR